MSDQRSFADALVSPRLGKNRKLEELHGLIDWSPLKELVGKIRQSDMGRPPYAGLSMTQALYLQALYDLSDAELEEALMDRLSFRRFCGFGLDAETPDATTICRFRQAAGEHGVMEACFAAINQQLDAKGLMARKGTLMDATIVSAKHNRPSIESGKGAKHPKEADADWTYKGKKSFFGYKIHVGMDIRGLVRRVVVTSAKVYESEVAEQLICGDEAAVYGDRAYMNKARGQRLKQRGIKDRTMHRANKWHPELPRWKQRHNALIARRRAPVEAVFSALKRFYGMGRARYATLERNTGRAFAAITMLNLCRARRMSLT
jgi:IS5 family transposase